MEMTRRASARGLTFAEYSAARGLAPYRLVMRNLYRPMGWSVVDRYCVAIGLHPLSVYPDFLAEAGA
jgi:hypothetical protein